jgi:hypothetical protein
MEILFRYVVLLVVLVVSVHSTLALLDAPFPGTLTAIEHRGRCPATHKQFYWTDAIESVTPENCFAQCVGDGHLTAGVAGCVFAFRSARTCVLFVDKRKVTGDGSLRVRKDDDCGSAVASPTGEDDVFLLPRVKLTTYLTTYTPVGTRRVVDAVHDYLPRARDRFMQRDAGSSKFLYLESRVTFEPAGEGGAGCCAGKCPDIAISEFMKRTYDVNVTGSLSFGYGPLADQIGRQFIWDNLFEPAYRGAFFSEKEIGALPTFNLNDCMCSRPGLCPSDERICIAGLTWRRDTKTYMLPGYLEVLMLDVIGTTSGDVLLNVGATMSVVLTTAGSDNWDQRADVKADFTCTAVVAAFSFGGGQVAAAVIVANPVAGLLLAMTIGFLDVFCISAAAVASRKVDEACKRCESMSGSELAVSMSGSELAVVTREALECNRTCTDPDGWYESAPHFFEAMSDDCEFVNGVPIRTFWAQVAGNPAAAKRLRSNYQTCKGLLDDPLLTKVAKIEDIKTSMDALDPMGPLRRPCKDGDWM